MRIPIMASNKIRSKNDTWTSEELQKALKEEDAAAGKKHHREKSSSGKKIRDTDKEDKGSKKVQDMATRRRQLQDEVEEEARRLKEARKVKKAEQNARSHTLTEDEERRRKRHEQKTKEGNALDKDEEERRRRRHERKLKEANQIEEEEQRKQKRHERKSKEDKLLADHDDEERRQKRREQKTKGRNVINDNEEDYRRRKQEQKTKERNTPDKDEEERRRRHERKKEGKRTEGDDEERRRQRRERKLKEENQEDEDENERRQRRHERRSKDADNDEEEQRRRRHERKLKEGKIAEEDDERRRRKRQEQKLKEKNQEYKDEEETQHRRKERHSKKESDKTTYQDIKSAGDKNLDNLNKNKYEEEVDYQQKQMAKGDIRNSPLQRTDKLETEMNGKSRDEGPTIQDDYNYEEDDFEDYSDDFDNDDTPEINQQQTFHEDSKENMEHSYLSSADSRSRDSGRVSSAEKSSSSLNERPSYQVMDFSHAKIQKMSQKTKSKLKTRSDDLCSLIALDVAVGQEVFELVPISEYELYIRNFGNANSSQVYVQTGDDNIDRDIQTEEIEYLDKWTQHPPNGGSAYGGNFGQNFNDTDSAAKSQAHDSARLNKFLLQATQVISIILEENLSSDTHNVTHQKTSELPFSKSFFTLSPCPLFQEHTIESCCFTTSAHTDYLLTVHNPPVITIKEKNRRKTTSLGSYVALWDLRTPSRPSKILFSESSISCCFGSLKSQLVLAGSVDGAVVVWDLRESESLHKQINLENIEYCVRYPAYNTAGVLSFNSHCSTIQTIRDIPSQGGGRETSVQKESFNSRFSCQLLSMDQSGLVNLWVVVELSSIDPSGSAIDLGLSPGSRIKLEHTSSINVHAAVRDSLFPTSICTQQLCLLPKDPNQIYIATDTGHVIHSVRLGSQPYPRVHCPRKVNLSSVLSQVLCLDFSPFMAPCFLTGHSDGSVNLYYTSLECPVVTWLPSQTGSESIVCVRWSQSRPTVFYVLNDSSTLFVFDLLEQDNNAVCTQTYEDRLTSINVICNSNSTDHTEKTESTEKMVLCFANGRIEVHTISDVFSESQTLEMEFLENYLQRM